MSSQGYFFFFPALAPLVKIRSRLSLMARKNMYEIFVRTIQPKAWQTVIDIGVTPRTEYPENNFFEHFYPYPDKITAVSVENASVIEKVFPGVRFIRIQPGPLPFTDKSFDILFCSAVLEHVGSRADQKAFLHELVRVSKRFFIATPNRWYPIDFHSMLPFIHWLPQKIHQKILQALGFSFLAKTENLNLCSITDVKKMLPDGCDYHTRYKWFLGLPSNILISSPPETPTSRTPQNTYLRFLLIGSLLGLAGITMIELIGWLLPQLFERFYFFIFSSVYFLGTIANFVMQSLYTARCPIVPRLYAPYLAFYTLMSLLCGGVASVFYGYLLPDFHHLIGIKSACCIASVLLLSPITCYGMVRILDRAKP